VILCWGEVVLPSSTANSVHDFDHFFQTKAQWKLFIKLSEVSVTRFFPLLTQDLGLNNSLY
jgi:hypothetical protein